jgi:hypothetical protein
VGAACWADRPLLLLLLLLLLLCCVSLFGFTKAALFSR